MRLGDLAVAEVAARLRGPGLCLRLGRLAIRVATDVATLPAQVRTMYADHRILDAPAIEDSVVAVRYRSPLRRFPGATVQGYVDGRLAFLPVLARAGLVMLESCLNWVTIGSGPDCLMIHAAALERNGRAVILPAESGSGKSTLTAAMVARGWRLLTDETTILRFPDGGILPLVRPISLKNASIAVARGLFDEAALSPVFHGMPKGDLVYVRPPAEAVDRIAEPAMPAHIVAPRFARGERLHAEPLSRCDAFRLLVDNAVNYPSTMRRGFDLVGDLAMRCTAHRLRYGALDQALDFLDRLEAAA